MHSESCAISHDYQSKRYENIQQTMFTGKQISKTRLVDIFHSIYHANIFNVYTKLDDTPLRCHYVFGVYFAE